MGRLDVRQAVASAVQNAGIDYVGTVYPARPTIAEETAYTETMSGQAIQESADGSACVVVVNMINDNRTRYALSGRGSMADFNKHITVLELFFACTGGNEISAQFDYDTVVDELVEMIRENPTMSAPLAVWSAGEYRYGVQHEQAQPTTSQDGLTTLINGVIRFEAWEQVVGPTPLPAD